MGDFETYEFLENLIHKRNCGVFVKCNGKLRRLSEITVDDDGDIILELDDD